MSGLTIIKMKVQHERHSEEISFPCSDKELYDKMVELRLSQPSVAKVYVSEILEPEELGLIQGEVVDLDEVNYLAKRMESFWGSEYWQFLEAARLEGFTQLKDLINLSFNLDKYTLIQDISDMGKVGREYVLNTEGAVPANDANDPKYARIGWQVLQTGKGIFTEHGFLVKDRDRPFEEPYNGKNFPPYLYQECVAVGEIQYGGNTEYVFLPDDEIVIDKALARLGVSNINQCIVKLGDTVASEDKMANQFATVIGSKDVYEMNRFLNELGEYLTPGDMLELLTVMKYTNISDRKNVLSIAENLHAFGIVHNVSRYADLAETWIKQADRLSISPELEEFFSYEAFGKALAEEYQGKFLEEGYYVYLREGYRLEDIIDTGESEAMAMGGM